MISCKKVGRGWVNFIIGNFLKKNGKFAKNCFLPTTVLQYLTNLSVPGDGHGKQQQGGDLTAGMQALPVGNIIKAKVLRKNKQEKVQTCIICE